MKSQPRITGQIRVPRSASLQKEIDKAVKHAAKQFGASKSWVVSVALADFFNIKIKRFDE